MSRRALLGAACAVTLAATPACGGDDSGADAPARPASARLVDTSQRPPLVNSLERDPASGEYLLTTNRGFFRIDAEAGRVRRVSGTVRAGNRRAPVGTFLELDLDDRGALVGSGHPDAKTLPQYLGYMRSEDGGRSWTVVSRLGDADLHRIIFKHGRLYAWDAVISAILISEDEGRTFTEHFTPRGLIIDFEVDPANPDRLVAATEDTLFRSEDGGDTWRPRQLEEGSRVAWPEPDALYLATADGRISRSSDGGDSFDEVGRVDGEPAVLRAGGDGTLDLALTDGTILTSADGGATWTEAFRP